MYAARRRQRAVQWKFQFGKLGIGQQFQFFDDLFGQLPQGSFVGHQVASVKRALTRRVRFENRSLAGRSSLFALFLLCGKGVSRSAR